MEPSELLARLATEFESMSVRYFVTGSMATIHFGEPRFTNDIDIVVVLELHRLPDFSAAFPDDEFYCSVSMIESAVRNKSQFNIIHPSSGLKIDVIVSDGSSFDQSRFSRRRELYVQENRQAWFASPEDVILKKLAYYQEGESEKHVRDILGVLNVQGESMDMSYLDSWARKLGLFDLWRKVHAQSTLADKQQRE